MAYASQSVVTMVVSTLAMGGSVTQLLPALLPFVMQAIDTSNPLHVAGLLLAAAAVSYYPALVAWAKTRLRLSRPVAKTPVYSTTTCAHLNGYMETKADLFYPAVCTFIRHLIDTTHDIPPYQLTVVVGGTSFEVCDFKFASGASNGENVWHVTERTTIRFEVVEKADNENRAAICATYKISIESPVSMAVVNSFIDDAQAFYANTSNALRIFRPTFNGYGLREHPFDTTKSFDNLHFADKQRLLKRVDMFMNRKDIYERVGMPHTLGILLHGPPGTGKTSAIKALARHMIRNPIIVPCSAINSYADLMGFLYNETLKQCNIPMEKRMFVIEEIDCGHFASIVRKRVPVAVSADEADTEESSATVKKPSTMGSESTLTLGQLLEALDGVFEMPGRVIVFTSNHPEQLDPALLRPGRIDLNVRMDLLKRKDVRAYYNTWFDTALPADVDAEVLDNTFSQATLGALFATEDMAHIHAVLCGKREA